MDHYSVDVKIVSLRPLLCWAVELNKVVGEEMPFLRQNTVTFFVHQWLDGKYPNLEDLKKFSQKVWWGWICKENYPGHDHLGGHSESVFCCWISTSRGSNHNRRKVVGNNPAKEPYMLLVNLLTCSLSFFSIFNKL